jgi:protein-S-isoprenylcysteine O-methyltransferase Ste14
VAERLLAQWRCFLFILRILPLTHEITFTASLLSLLSVIIFSAALWETNGKKFDVAFTGSLPPSLATSGIYSKIRNPMYLSYIFYWNSWWVATNFSYISSAAAVLFLLVYCLTALREEQSLRTAFG